jgi:hypothetical protein
MLEVYKAYLEEGISLFVMDVPESGMGAEILDGPFHTTDEVIESMKKFQERNKYLKMPDERLVRVFVESVYQDGLFA